MNRSLGIFVDGARVAPERRVTLCLPAPSLSNAESHGRGDKMVQTIAIDKVVIPEYQRDVRQDKVRRIAEKIRERGYNTSYPITLDQSFELIDGGHRLEAARLAGMKDIPFVFKPEDVSNIVHAIHCNLDGADTEPYDVFDYAQHCWARSEQGWTGQMIGNELGQHRTWAAHHKAIREKLCPSAWDLARGVTKNPSLVTEQEKSLVTSSVTIVTPWQESHFRALFKHLSYDTEAPDELIAQAQVDTIGTILLAFAEKIKDENDKLIKVTAKWIGIVAQEHAWYVTLKRIVLGYEHHIDEAKIQELIKSIEQDDFGAAPSNDELDRLRAILDAMGKKVPTLHHGLAEDMHFLEGESIDLIITSPPYNIGGGNWPMGGQGRTPRENGIGYSQHDDAMPEDEYQAWQLECLKEMYRVSKEGASLFYNHKVRSKDGRAIHPMEWIGHPDNPWILRQEIIWDRRSTHNHSKTLFWPHDERIYWLTKGRPKLPGKPIGFPTIVSWGGPKPGTDHPAPFHPDLPRLCLNAVGTDDIVVLDPFCGSCTTLKVALEEFGHDAIGVDKDEKYLKQAIEENGWTTPNET